MVKKETQLLMMEIVDELENQGITEATFVIKKKKGENYFVYKIPIKQEKITAKEYEELNAITPKETPKGFVVGQPNNYKK
jgi:hypothetical protein